jgi:hypothetical protein
MEVARFGALAMLARTHGLWDALGHRQTFARSGARTVPGQTLRGIVCDRPDNHRHCPDGQKAEFVASYLSKIVQAAQDGHAFGATVNAIRSLQRRN